MYTFSYRYTAPMPVVKRRPWWRFWAYDTVVFEDRWQQRSLTGLSAVQANFIQGMLGNNPELVEVFSELLIRPGERVEGFQLEQALGPTPLFRSGP